MQAQTTDDFRQLYATKPDGELLRLAVEADELSDVAQQALQAELQKRGFGEKQVAEARNEYRPSDSGNTRRFLRGVVLAAIAAIIAGIVIRVWWKAPLANSVLCMAFVFIFWYVVTHLVLIRRE